MARILCVEDSKEFQIYLSSVLREHSLTHVGTVRDAYKLFEKASHSYDLIIVDVSLPDGNGLNIIPTLKDLLQERPVPFIIISSDNNTLTKVAAFGVGADDFIVKPPESSELKARVEAKLRLFKTLSVSQNHILYEDISVDSESMQVVHIKEDGQRSEILLTPVEFKILKLMMVRPGVVYSRDQIIERVWGDGKYITSRTVDTHISHLRTKLAASRVEIQTVLGAGYKLAKVEN